MSTSFRSRIVARLFVDRLCEGSESADRCADLGVDVVGPTGRLVVPDAALDEFATWVGFNFELACEEDADRSERDALARVYAKAHDHDRRADPYHSGLAERIARRRVAIG